MSKISINRIYNKASLFERLALYGNRTDFLKSLAQTARIDSSRLEIPVIIARLLESAKLEFPEYLLVNFDPQSKNWYANQLSLLKTVPNDILEANRQVGILEDLVRQLKIDAAKHYREKFLNDSDFQEISGRIATIYKMCLEISTALKPLIRERDLALGI